MEKRNLPDTKYKILVKNKLNEFRVRPDELRTSTKIYTS